MPHSNGTGARPPEVFTFASTGYTVQYRRIPLRLLNDFEIGWRKNPDNKPPVPPTSVVDVSGEKKAIANTTDPDYQQALVQYDTDAREASFHFQWEYAIVLTEEDRADVATLREDIRKRRSVELDPSDEWVFVHNIAGGEQEEVVELQKLILRLSQPTPEAVTDIKASFQN